MSTLKGLGIFCLLATGLGLLYFGLRMFRGEWMFGLTLSSFGLGLSVFWLEVIRHLL